MFKLVPLSALLAATAAVAQAPGDAANGKKTDPNEVICRTQNSTGSRLDRVRVCKTRAEWAQVRQEQRTTMDRVQNVGGTSGQ